MKVGPSCSKDEEPPKEEFTVLHDLLEDGGIVEPFLQLPNLETEHRDAKGRTLLLAACRSRLTPDRSIDGADRDRRVGAIVSIKDPRYTDKPSLVEFLIGKGACAAVQDYEKKNALHHILSKEREGGHKSLQLIISLAPEIVRQHDSLGETPLHYALRRALRSGGPDTEAVEMILAAGADPHLPDAQGNTALHLLGTWLAERSRHPRQPDKLRDLFKRFISLGLPINGRNLKGETPTFAFFASQGTKRDRVSAEGWEAREEAALKILADAGADFFAVNHAGETLLHTVALTANAVRTEGMVERFRWLLDRGLDPLAEDANHRTCLDVAAMRKNQHILELYGRDT